jgi:hypothetical protein
MLNHDAACFPQILLRAFTHMVEKMHPGTIITQQTLPNVNPTHICLKVTVPTYVYYQTQSLKVLDHSASNCLTDRF